MCVITNINLYGVTLIALHKVRLSWIKIRLSMSKSLIVCRFYDSLLFSQACRQHSRYQVACSCLSYYFVQSLFVWIQYVDLYAEETVAHDIMSLLL